MARNRKYQSAAIRFGPPLKVFLFCSLIGGSALGYVWQKDQISQLGRQINRYEVRLDELPQLLNVLKGDMSFVGPRPERPEFVAALSEKIPYYYIRHTVKPGITGWAQVSYPYGASVEDSRMKLEYDLYYIKHMSLFFDCKVFLRTIGVILFPSGSR